jgi:hypothetical protein
MFIVASGSTRRSSSIFRQLPRSSFFAPIFKRKYTIGIDKNDKAKFPENRKRVKGTPTLATRLFSHTNTGDDDNDDEDNYFRFPPLTGNILVVGDGDFSYSVALAKENQTIGDANITASSLDTKDFIEETYSKGKANLDSLDLDSNVYLKHELDITENGSCGNERVWDSILWNLPYPPNTKWSGHLEGKALMTGFLRNMSRILKPDGFIFVTLCDQQGDIGRWDLEGIAWDSNLAVTKVLSFCASNITGYVPKRAYNDEEIPFNICHTSVIRHQKDKAKYFSELESLASIRWDIYDTYSTPEQTYRLLKEENDITPNKLVDSLKILSRIGKFYLEERNNDGSYQHVLKSLEYCTAENVQTLLEEEATGELEAGQFRIKYERKFGTPPFPEGVKVRDALDELSDSGKFLVDRRVSSPVNRRNPSLWITQLGKRHVRNANKSVNCTAKEICELLKVNGGKLEGRRFRSRFEEEFGRPPFPEGAKVSEALKELARSGKFFVDHQGSSLWITKLGKSKNVPIKNADCTADEISILLRELDAEIYVGQFRTRFEEKFGRPPFPKGAKMKDALEKLSHSGTFQLETRGYELWIKKVGKRRRGKINANVHCTAKNICELLKESDREINGGRFRDKFEQKYGRPPFPKGVKLKDALKKLSHSGTFQLETRGSELWITKVGKRRCRKLNANVHFTAKEICELLEENGGEIYYGEFRAKFERKFRTLKGGNLMKSLRHLSPTGNFHMETRAGGLWITLPSQ